MHLWGSLSYGAFDETCRDVDCIAVTRRDLHSRESLEPDEWCKEMGENNCSVKRMEMRFVIGREFLDKSA